MELLCVWTLYKSFFSSLNNITGLSLRAVTHNTCYSWIHSMLQLKMSIHGTSMLHLFLNIKHNCFLVSCLLGSTIYILLWRWTLLRTILFHLNINQVIWSFINRVIQHVIYSILSSKIVQTTHADSKLPFGQWFLRSVIYGHFKL